MHRGGSAYTAAMKRRIRIVLTWLLLAALPLQGVAGVTMLHCGPSHHETMASLPPAQPAPHQHADAEHRHHHPAPGAAEGVTTVSSASVDDAMPAADLATLTTQQCSACASCCVGAALPVARVVVEPIAPALPPPFVVGTPTVGFFTDGPDRPPRLPLA